MRIGGLAVGALVALLLVGAATAQVVGEGVCTCDLTAGNYVVNQKIEWDPDHLESGCIDVYADGVVVGQVCWELTLDDEDEPKSLEWWTEYGTFTGTVCVKGATQKNTYSYTDSDGAIGLVTPTGQAISHFMFCGTFAPDEEEWCGETAWATGARYVARGNWATYTQYPTSPVTLLAGQTMPAGTVSFSSVDNDMVTITITLNSGWRFNPDPFENVHIQGYVSQPPSENPAPGQFDEADYAEDSPFSITVFASDEEGDPYNYYGVHVDVEHPCE